MECENVVREARAGDKALASAGFGLILKARVLYQWHKIDKASEALQEGINITSELGVTDSFGMGRMLQARILAATDDIDGAISAIRNALRYVTVFEIVRLTQYVRAWDIRLQLRAGNLQTAKTWAEGYRLQNTAECVTDVEDLTPGQSVLGRWAFGGHLGGRVHGAGRCRAKWPRFYGY